jgi:hypothetical protein
MTVNTAQAGALSFAHLAGITRPINARADVPDGDKKDDKDASKTQGADESDDDYAKRMEAEDDDKKDDDKAKKAESDDEDEKMESDDKDPEDDKKDSKKARGTSGVSRGVTMERARWTAVIGSRAFSRNPAVGAHMLASTSMSASAILGVLRDTPVSASAADSRSARNPNIGTDAAAAPTGASAIQNAWGSAFKRAGVA